MSGRGRPAKPTALKVLQGNPGKRPLNRTEPKPPLAPRTPNAPVWLNAPARKLWKRYARLMWELGLLTEADVEAFGAWCTWLALYILANERLDEGGVVQEASSGWKGPAVWFSVANQAWVRVEKLSGLFGMTPSDRSKLRIESVEKELDLAEQLFALTQQKHD